MPKTARLKGPKPTYIVKAMRTMRQSAVPNGATADMKGKVGAAWVNTDGSISIDLDPFVVLEAHPDLHITLFLNDKEQLNES